MRRRALAWLGMFVVLGGCGGDGGRDTTDVKVMRERADKLVERVRNNKDWLDAQRSCAKATCTITAPGYDVRGFDTNVRVTPIDSPLDTIPNPPAGAKPEEIDRDHVIPDLYRITVTVSDDDRRVRRTSTIDARQLGAGTGEKTVRVCASGNWTQSPDDSSSCGQR